MSQSALELVLVMVVGLIALTSPVVIPTRLATADLSAVAVDADVENLATGGVLTDTPTNNQNQGGKPFRGKAVDKGRRLWEALNLLWVELPLRGPSTGETPVDDDDRGFTLPLEAEQLNRDDHAPAFHAR